MSPKVFHASGSKSLVLSPSNFVGISEARPDMEAFMLIGQILYSTDFSQSKRYRFDFYSVRNTTLKRCRRITYKRD